MPARKLPTTEDTVTARRILLDGLTHDASIVDLAGELAPLHPRNNTFPGDVFLNVAADALGWCGAGRISPLSVEGIGDRFLPECLFRGRQNNKFQYAVLAAAALHCGTEPDLLDEIAWWQTDDFCQYALFATVACTAPLPTRRVCRFPRNAGNSPAPGPLAQLNPVPCSRRQQQKTCHARAGARHDASRRPPKTADIARFVVAGAASDAGTEQRHGVRRVDRRAGRFIPDASGPGMRRRLLPRRDQEGQNCSSSRTSTQP